MQAKTIFSNFNSYNDEKALLLCLLLTFATVGWDSPQMLLNKKLVKKGYERTNRLFHSLFFIGLLCCMPLFLFGQTPTKVAISIHFSPPSPLNIAKVSWLKNHFFIYAKDTTLLLNIRGTKQPFLIEAEGYETVHTVLNADSLRLTNKMQVVVKEKVISLNEVSIRSERMMYNRGDTLIIRTDSIRTKPFSGATELMNKVPGMTIDANGQLSIMGKAIQKVTVEGKSLFGGSPKATLEVLRSEMVQQLEVVDNAQAGAHMNIKLKADKKKGIYGNVGVSLGLNGRYSLPIQANSINDKQFINGFINANNTNENTLNDQQETWLINHFILGDTQGAYSVVDVATFNGSVNLNPNVVNNLPTNDKDKGVFSSFGGGANYTKTSEKQEWFGYVMTDFSSQQTLNTRNQQNILGTIRQGLNSKQMGSKQHNSVWSAVSATLKPNEKDTWRWGLRLNLQGITQSVADTQRVDNEENDVSISRSTTALNKQLATHSVYASPYLGWVHRFAKPAQLFSVYANSNSSSLGLEQTYTNEWLGRAGRVLSNNHQIFRSTQTQALNLQMLYTQPLARRWLGEIRGSLGHENLPINQQAFQFNAKTKQYDLQRPDLSLEALKLLNNEQTLSFSVLYKGSKTTLKTGIAYWNWQGNRLILGQNPIVLPTKQWLLQLYWQYLGHKGKININYNTLFEAIAPHKLLPVIDSSDVQQVSVGNLYLQSFYTSKIELRASTSTQGGSLYSLSMKYEKNENPVLFATQLSPQGLSSFGFAQLSDVQKIRATVLWTQFSRSKPYNFTFFVMGAWQQHNTLFNGQLQYFENYHLFTSLSFQWNISKWLHLKADGKTTLFQQKYQGGYRGDLSLNLSYQWLDKWYIELHNTSFFSKNATSQTVNYQLINAHVYRYLLPTQRLRLSLGVNNLLDVRNTFDNYLSANTKTEEFSNRMPRLFMIGLTYYADKWKK